MSILVTGGTGFLGSHLLQALAGSGIPVRALYRKTIPVVPEADSNKVQWVQADILDTIALEEALQDITTVYHCAGKVSFLRKDKHELIKINGEGTANVVNLCIEKGIRKLVHVSSVAAIGRAQNGRHITESNKWEDSPNNSCYAFSKYLGEMEVWRGIGEGLNAVIVNPSVIIGAGNWNEGSSALIRKAYEEFPFYTTGVNGFVDVRDVVRAMILLMESDISAERFILNGDNWSYKELFTVIAQCLHKRPPFKRATPWMGGLVWRWEKLRSGLLKDHQPVVTKETARTAQLKVYYHADKIRQFLPGFSFTPLQQTIADTCAAFLEEKQADLKK